jgi:site-specific DNA recombinase
MQTKEETPDRDLVMQNVERLIVHADRIAITQRN